MTRFNSVIISNKNGSFRKGLKFKNIACLLFISIFLISSFFFNNLNLNYNPNSQKNPLELDELKNYNSPEISTDLEDLFQNPYTVNFSKMWTFFSDKFESKLNYDIPLYVSESDKNGIIVDNTTFSKDNLLLYKSLLKENYGSTEAYNAYSDLKKTPLWYPGNEAQFEYGFVSSINGSTGLVKDDNRYLIDNLIPIFLLLENKVVNDAIHSELLKIFNLINSTQFYTSDKGFLEYNKTTSTTKYYTEGNLYAILALFLIHRYDSKLVEPTKSIIYNLANNTLNTLVKNMWDKTYLGFYYSAESGWIKSGPANTHKYLDTNALGIIALLDAWTKNDMVANSVYIKNATSLYDRMSRPSGSDGLWNVSVKAYENYRLNTWGSSSNTESKKIDLESNALMMLACLKLFEATGNFTYYNRSITLFEMLRDKFYSSSINAHRTSIGIGSNSNVKLYPNLVLCDAYLKAKEIYRSTILTADFNVSGKTDFIMNQEQINLTCSYAFEKNIDKLTGGSGGSYGSTKISYNTIIGASINYIFKYPNGSNFEYIQNTFENNESTLIYPVNNSLPMKDGYKIVIFANWTYFGFANTSEYFNVKSGLKFQRVLGLEDSVYQSQTKNVTIIVKNEYNYNLTMNVTLYGSGIDGVLTKTNIFFRNNANTSVSFNTTIKNSATTGSSTIYFTFVNGTILYLNYGYIIYILNALSYSNLMYSKKIVPGNYIKVFIELNNFLSNESQELNLIFSGTHNYLINQSITLQKKERSLMSVSILTLPAIYETAIQIDMIISKGNIEFYKEELVISIVSKLEIKSVSFPEKVKQGITFLGADSYLIVVIENNLETSEEFTLFIDDAKTDSKLDELVPGENRIEVKLSPAWNPYEFGIKTLKIEIEDSTEEVIYEKILEYEIELSALNLIIFYMLPIVVLIGIVLYYKNKEIKNKLLRR